VRVRGLSLHRCPVCDSVFLSTPCETRVCSVCGSPLLVLNPTRWAGISASLLFSAGLLGFLFFVTNFFPGFVYGRINFVPGNLRALMEMVYALVQFCSSFAAVFFSLDVFRGNINRAPFSALGGVFGFGFGAGVVLALLGLGVAAFKKDDFYVEVPCAEQHYPAK